MNIFFVFKQNYSEFFRRIKLIPHQRMKRGAPFLPFLF